MSEVWLLLAVALLWRKPGSRVDSALDTRFSESKVAFGGLCEEFDPLTREMAAGSGWMFVTVE